MRGFRLTMVLAMLVACSSFESNPEPAGDAGADAAPTIDAATDEGTPVDASNDIVDSGPKLETFKDGQLGVERLVSNGTHLAWAVSESNGEVRACQLPTCTDLREIATQQQSITGLALGIADKVVNVFWSTTTKVWRRFYGNAVTVEVGTVAPTITGLARFEGRTVWTTEGTIYRCPDVAPDAAKCVTNEASGAQNLHALFADTDNSRAWLAAASDIRHAPATIGSIVPFRNQSNVRSIVTDSLRVYWTVAFADGGEVRSVPMAAPNDTPTTHFAGNEPFELVDDNASLYVALRASGDIVRIDKAKKTASIIANVSAPRGLALAGGYLYIAASGENRIARIKVAP